MDNYKYNSYPDSADSSPRSREIEFENPTPPWDDQQQQQNSNTYKVKFMCSYGGKIHPRPHDNQLSYIGGETKILAVDRNTKFSTMIAKLSALCGDTDVSFKYQLPGEDLDALISVTNDDDLEHMMHEYDRLYRASAKPARMRLFLFPVNPSPASFSSDGGGGGKLDRDRFVEALNSGPGESAKVAAQSNVDFLFGLEKGGVAAAVPPPPPPVKVPDLPELHVGHGRDDRVIGSDPVNLQNQLQRLHIRDHIRDHEQQAMYRKSSDENLVGGYPTAAAHGGDYYLQKLPEKIPPASMPVSVPPPVTAPPPGYWPPEKQVHGFSGPVAVTTAPPPQDQPVYVIPGAGAVYHHPPVVRQVSGQTGQGYYVQRVGGPDVYREQPVYNVVPQPGTPPPPMSAAGTGPMGMVRQGGVGVPIDGGYAPVTAGPGYENVAGRQQGYYAAPGGPYHGEMRPGPGAGGAALGPEGKVVTKVTQA